MKNSCVLPDRVLRRDYANGTCLGVTYDGQTGVSNPAGDYGFLGPSRLVHTRISDEALVSDSHLFWDRMRQKDQEIDLAPWERTTGWPKTRRSA